MVLNSFIVSFIVGNREGCVLHRFLNSGVRRDKRTVNSLLLSMQFPLINVNSVTRAANPWQTGWPCQQGSGPHNVWTWPW